MQIAPILQFKTEKHIFQINLGRAELTYRIRRSNKYQAMTPFILEFIN